MPLVRKPFKVFIDFIVSKVTNTEKGRLKKVIRRVFLYTYTLIRWHNQEYLGMPNYIWWESLPPLRAGPCNDGPRNCLAASPERLKSSTTTLDYSW